MRELKFRAFHKELKKMYSVFSFCEQYIQFESDGNMFKWRRSEFEPIMQFTGVRDNTGMEIYEGDILQANYCKGVITWFWHGWHIKSVTGEYHTLRTAVHSFLVIGNIHTAQIVGA